MVPGLTEREMRAAEMRRQELLAEAMGRQSWSPLHPPVARPLVPAWRRSIGAALVRAGRRLRGSGGIATGATSASEPVATGR
jgi:hypothetical protein